MFDHFARSSQTSVHSRLAALISDARADREPIAMPVVFATEDEVSSPTARGQPNARLRRWSTRWLPAAGVARRRFVVGGAAVAGVGVAAAFALGWQRQRHEESPYLPIAVAAATQQLNSLVIDVAGEVPSPGLVTVTSGARVAEAVKAAGGAHPGVDLRGLNLARKLVDGEQIVVGAPAAGGTTRPAERLNINTASAEELDGLPGVGPVTAKRIVERRRKIGSFESVEQLGDIDGLGKAKVVKLAELVRV